VSSSISVQNYAIDAAHSTVQFTVRHLMIAKIHGRFAAVTGTLEILPESSVPTAIDVSIDVASIDTREEQRDGHLKSPEFFDVATYPYITFLSTRVEGDGDRFRVYGDLTIHGTTREVALDTAFGGRARDPWGNQRVGFEALTTIDRKDFGLTHNMALETGGVLVGDEVSITLDVEAVAQQ